MRRVIAVVVAVVVGAGGAWAQPVDPYGEPEKKKEDKKEPKDPYEETGPGSRTGTVTGTTTGPKAKGLDIEAIQGLLAVQTLDGWLLYDRDGQNPIARKLVTPEGSPSRAWFYLIPSSGDATLLCHQSETHAFNHLPGKVVTYAGYRDLGKQLKRLLEKKGKKKLTIAMEYSAKGAVPSVSRVDAGTIELVKGFGVTIKSSSGLVQFTKALWGPEGRKQHYVAVHHLTELRKEALAWLAKQIRDGKPVSELDVRKRLVRGMKMRGLEGPVPVVAAGAHTADPFYVPTEESSVEIKQGDLVVLSLAGRTTHKDGIYAATTWCAFVGETVSPRFASAFEVVSLARDEAIALITDRIKRRRAVKGHEVDAAARGFIDKAGFGNRFTHRTGHAIDSDLQGVAADLDDYEIKEVRPLAVGSGFTIGPGIYLPGEYGVRAEVSAYLGPKGLEVTTPKQEAIEPLLAK